jgi:hypothetical protein
MESLLSIQDQKGKRKVMSAFWLRSLVLALLCAFPVAALAGWDLLDLRPLKAGAESSIESRRRAWDNLHAASALQGLVNRSKPGLYILLVGQDAEYDRFWLKRLRETWLKGEPDSTTLDFLALLEKHKKAVKGLAVWDESVPATALAASTAAGVESLLPVRFDPSPESLYTTLTKRWKVKVWLIQKDGSRLFAGAESGSAKNDVYAWAVDRYLKAGRVNPLWLAHYPDAGWIKSPKGIPLERTLLSNHDFFISKKAFFFDLSPWDDEAPDDDLSQPLGSDFHSLLAILKRTSELAKGKFIHVGGFTPWDQKYTRFTGQKHGEVETEWRFAEILSSFNAYLDADAAGLHGMANASFYSHEPLKKVYPQNKPTLTDLKVKGFIDAAGRVVPKRYVTFYVGDYDSSAWLYQMLPEKWSDPSRGSIPLGWAFNPALAQRFPTGMAYARKKASPNDFFVAGDSGVGYINPGMLEEPRQWSGLASGVAEWVKLNKKLFKQWDLGIIGFVIDGNAPAMSQALRESYARFSPNGVVAQKTPYLSHVQGTPFLRMGSDLDRHQIPEGINRVNGIVPRDGLHFAIFRTILWNPSDHKAFFEALKLARPDIEIVDPYTLFLLAKESKLTIP